MIFKNNHDCLKIFRNPSSQVEANFRVKIRHMALGKYGLKRPQVVDLFSQLFLCNDFSNTALKLIFSVYDGQGGLACCDSWDRKELDTTE